MKEKFNMEPMPIINNLKEKENIINNLEKKKDYIITDNSDEQYRKVRQANLLELYKFLYDIAHIISSASYKLKHPDDTSLDGLFESCCKKLLENHPDIFNGNNLQMYFLKSADLIKEIYDKEYNQKSFPSKELESLYHSLNHSLELMYKNAKYGLGIED